MNGMLEGLSMYAQMMEAAGTDATFVRKWIADTKHMLDNYRNPTTMSEKYKMLEEFSDAFSIKNKPGVEHFDPSIPDETTKRALRYYLMKEEVDEYLYATDIVDIADALADQMYILIGTIMAHGLQDVFEDIFKEVHRSNMSKLGEDNRPIYREDGKVMKGPNYSRPDIKSIIEKHLNNERQSIMHG